MVACFTAYCAATSGPIVAAMSCTAAQSPRRAASSTPAVEGAAPRAAEPVPAVAAAGAGAGAGTSPKQMQQQQRNQQQQQHAHSHINGNGGGGTGESGFSSS
mmetsp:Transcript_36081/g.90028  ORF Transcript_36081/g.90028 Transcript_36081/m.90028 type:complete len:102 (+) Transcript_36081:1308-1613(+)